MLRIHRVGSSKCEIAITVLLVFGICTSRFPEHTSLVVNAIVSAQWMLASEVGIDEWGKMTKNRFLHNIGEDGTPSIRARMQIGYRI